VANMNVLGLNKFGLYPSTLVRINNRQLQLLARYIQVKSFNWPILSGFFFVLVMLLIISWLDITICIVCVCVCVMHILFLYSGVHVHHDFSGPRTTKMVVMIIDAGNKYNWSGCLLVKCVCC
jgi:VIT1/CCC1 family predicted Fe2+/Mn2+ transporter